MAITKKLRNVNISCLVVGHRKLGFPTFISFVSKVSCWVFWMQYNSYLPISIKAKNNHSDFQVKNWVNPRHRLCRISVPMLHGTRSFWSDIADLSEFSFHSHSFKRSGKNFSGFNQRIMMISIKGIQNDSDKNKILHAGQNLMSF